MSSFSGDDKSFPPIRKHSSLKLSTPKRLLVEKEWTTVTSKPGKSQIVKSLVYLNFKHIIDNRPQLNLSITYRFRYY